MTVTPESAGGENIVQFPLQEVSFAGAVDPSAPVYPGLSPDEAAKLDSATDYLQFLGEQNCWLTTPQARIVPDQRDNLDILSTKPGTKVERRWEVVVDGIRANLTLSASDVGETTDWKYSLSVDHGIDGYPVPEPPSPEEAETITNGIYKQSLLWRNGVPEAAEPIHIDADPQPEQSVIGAISARLLSWLRRDDDRPNSA